MTWFLGASAAATAGLGIYKTLKGNSQISDARNRAKLNIRPTYPIQQQYYDNQNLASSMASTGLSDAEKNYYNTNAERGLTTGIGAALQTGQGPNAIGNLYDSFLRGQNQLASTGDQLRTQKLQTLMEANRALADQETQKWALDKYEPFKDEAKAIAGEKTAGQQGVNDGLNTVVGAINSYTSGRTNFADKAGGTAGGAADALALGREQGAMPELTTSSAGVGPITLSNQIPEDAINSTRNVAMGDIISKYKDSPYFSGMYDYLSPTL
jgi:hypothetical protein